MKIKLQAILSKVDKETANKIIASLQNLLIYGRLGDTLFTFKDVDFNDSQLQNMLEHLSYVKELNTFFINDSKGSAAFKQILSMLKNKLVKEEQIPITKLLKGKTLNFTKYQFPKNIDYNKLLTPENKRKIEDSIKAAKYEGNKDVVLDIDGMVVDFIDKLSSSDYKLFNYKQAEKVFKDYTKKMWDKIH